MYHPYQTYLATVAHGAHPFTTKACVDSSRELLPAARRPSPRALTLRLGSSVLGVRRRQRPFSLTVGRSGKCHVVLDAELVSRVHLVLHCFPAEGFVVVRDTGGLHGLYVGGRRRSHVVVPWGTPASLHLAHPKAAPLELFPR